MTLKLDIGISERIAFSISHFVHIFIKGSKGETKMHMYHSHSPRLKDSGVPERDLGRNSGVNVGNVE